MVGDGKNVPAGTAMTGYGGGTPDSFHFHLCSHAGIGTVNPTFYQVLHDDNDLELDNVVKMTNALTLDSKRCEKRYVSNTILQTQIFIICLVSPSQLQFVSLVFVQNVPTITGKVALIWLKLECVHRMLSMATAVRRIRLVPGQNSKSKTFSSKSGNRCYLNSFHSPIFQTVAKQGLPIRLFTLLNSFRLFSVYLLGSTLPLPTIFFKKA